MNWALSERGELILDIFIFILSVRVNHVLNSTIELGVENYSKTSVQNSYSTFA